MLFYFLVSLPLYRKESVFDCRVICFDVSFASNLYRHLENQQYFRSIHGVSLQQLAALLVHGISYRTAGFHTYESPWASCLINCGGLNISYICLEPSIPGRESFPIKVRSLATQKRWPIPSP